MSESVFRSLQRTSSTPKATTVRTGETVRTAPPGDAQALRDAVPRRSRKTTVYPDLDLAHRVQQFASVDRDRFGRRYSEAEIFVRLASLGAEMLERIGRRDVPVRADISAVLDAEIRKR